MKLETIVKGAVISGIVQGAVARVISVDPLGENLVSVVYKRTTVGWARTAIN